MNFDVRSYCERIKRANPKRFEFAFSVLVDYVRGTSVIADNRADETKMWAFIGPIAEELGVTEIDLTSVYHVIDATKYPYDTLLETMFAAVCEKLEYTD